MNFSRLKNLSVLIVEQSINIQTSKSELEPIKSLFGKVYESKSSNALEVFRQNIDDIDMIIIDIDSIEELNFIRSIKALKQSVVLLSFLYCNNSQLTKELVDLEIDSFLIRPLNIAKMAIKLNKIARYILSKQELESKNEIIDKNFIYSETDTKGIITYVSQPFVELSGYSKDELIGKAHNIIRHKDVDPSVFKDLWSTVKSGKTWTGEVKNLKKDGSYYVVKSVVTPMYYKKNIVGYCSARVDMTQVYKRAKELHLHSKYKAMNEMLSMVSHHWRQPIASIGLEVDNALFDITLGDMVDKESITASLKSINEKVQHLSSILNTFKSFVDKNPKEVLSLDLLMQNVVFVMRGPLDESGIDIKTNLLSKNISLYTYKSELINVLINIIINAKENIVKNSIKDGSIEMSCEVFDKNLEIKIRDNGGGIDERVIEEIFEPYISTKEAKNGTGLGLYIVKELVEKKLDGTVSAKNLNNGAEFTLNIQGVIDE